MFPLQPNKDLSFKISSPQDLKMGHAALLDSMKKTRRGRRFNGSCGDDCKKKIMHKDLEKLRRQEMANLHASLRFLLPFEFIKGKRSVSDHMNEAVKYIKHLKERIKALNAKRDELKRLTSFHHGLDPKTGMSENGSPNCVEVHPCLGGFEIVFSNGLRDQTLTLSRVLQTLISQGFNVVSCVSTKVNQRLLYNIKSEVSDSASIDISGLQKILREVLST